MNIKEIIIDLASKADIVVGRDILIHDDRFYDRVFRYTSLGLGETYMLGWWSAGSMSIDQIIFKITRSDISTQLTNMSKYAKMKLGLSWLYHYWFPVKTIEDSKVVALQHYDLDRKIYESMLKPMVYSCGYFKDSDDSLYQAQINKMDMCYTKLKLKPGMRVLDIGCGWGELCNHFGKYKVYIDGITISEEQYKYANEKFENDYVHFYLEDYRKFDPVCPYDAIVSVGMFEHVNSQNYQEFMTIVSKMLKPGGLFLLHTIGGNKTKIIPDPWVGKYIFPNSCLPSLAQISSASEKIFVIEDVHNFGYHYSETLMCWYENFLDNINELDEKLEKPLTEEFVRMWTYYLLSCAGAFRARDLQLYQVVLSKEPNVGYIRPKNY